MANTSSNLVVGQSPMEGPLPSSSEQAAVVSAALQNKTLEVSLFSSDKNESDNSRKTFSSLVEGLKKNQSVISAGSSDPNASTVARVPFVFTCQKWLENSSNSNGQNTPAAIVWRCNPDDVSWKLPQRSAERKTRLGTILHTWKDTDRGTFYDEPTLTFSLQSGNIIPIPHLGNKIAPLGRSGEELEGEKLDSEHMPQGMSNFYNFLKLVDEQKIMDDGRVNLVYVIYNSNVFPSLTLSGLFTPSGTSWSDSANSPNQVNSWSTEFTVYDSYPKLNDAATMIRVFTDMQYRK